MIAATRVSPTGGRTGAVPIDSPEGREAKWGAWGEPSVPPTSVGGVKGTETYFDLISYATRQLAGAFK